MHVFDAFYWMRLAWESILDVADGDGGEAEFDEAQNLGHVRVALLHEADALLLVDVADGLGGVPYVVSGDREHPDYPVSEARRSPRENSSILIGLGAFQSLGSPRALRRRLGET